MLEHVAAWLGIEMPSAPTLWDRVHSVGELTNLVVHWTGDATKQLDATRLYAEILRGSRGKAQGDGVVPAGVASEPGSLVARFSIPRRISSTGYEIATDVDEIIRSWKSSEEAA
jgi:hypothetical protein